MKYIISESQYNMVLESQNRIELFQELIDTKLDYMRRACETGHDEYEGDVGDESCRQIEQVEKIEVISVNWITLKHSNREQEEKFYNVIVKIYYSSIRPYGFYADDLIYDLNKILRKSTSMPLVINYETTNTRKNFNW